MKASETEVLGQGPGYCNVIKVAQDNHQLQEAFTYSDYESFVRFTDSDTLRRHREHLAGFVKHFKKSRLVLDLACGQGIFLDLLRDAGIQALGVDADTHVVQDAESRGHRVIAIGITDFLATTRDTFDGIFCSHLIEHLPFEVVLRMIQGVSKCTEPGAIFVLAFPNPRSIRAHLDQFWIDPQHVRFYDRLLIEGVLKWSGFEIVSNGVSGNEQYRYAPDTLLQKLNELENLIGSCGSGTWYHSEHATGSIVRKAKVKIMRYIRSLIGVTDLSRGLASLNSVVGVIHKTIAELVLLTDGPDIEVRIVARKL